MLVNLLAVYHKQQKIKETWYMTDGQIKEIKQVSKCQRQKTHVNNIIHMKIRHVCMLMRWTTNTCTSPPSQYKTSIHVKLLGNYVCFCNLKECNWQENENSRVCLFCKYFHLAERDWIDMSRTLILFTVPLWLTRTTCSSLSSSSVRS